MSLITAVIISLPNGLFQVGISLIMSARKKGYEYCFTLLSRIGILSWHAYSFLGGEGRLLWGKVPRPSKWFPYLQSPLVPIHSGFCFYCAIAPLFMCHFIPKMLTVPYYQINPFPALISPCHSPVQKSSVGPHTL